MLINIVKLNVYFKGIIDLVIGGSFFVCLQLRHRKGVMILINLIALILLIRYLFLKWLDKNNVDNSDEEYVNYCDFIPSVPYNIRKRNAINTFLHTEKSQVNMKTDKKTLEPDNGRIEPASLLINGKTGEISTPSDLLNSSTFNNDNLTGLDLEQENHIVINNNDISKKHSTRKIDNVKNVGNWKEINKKAINELLK